MANLKDLQQAASTAAGKVRPVPRKPVHLIVEPPPPVVEPVTTPSAGEKSTSRSGKIGMTFHLAADFKKSLRLVQAYRGGSCTFEQLAAEAFNDLFSKYNAPTINNDS